MLLQELLMENEDLDATVADKYFKDLKKSAIKGVK